MYLLSRRVALSPSEEHAVVWWSASDQEVFPWAPNLREEDRANVMLFSLKVLMSNSRYDLTIPTGVPVETDLTFQI